MNLLFALYLKNVLGKEIVIITSNKDTVKYCKAENINYLQINQLKPSIASIFKLFAFKKMLDELIKKIDMGKEDVFITTGIVTGYGTFYLAKELSKKGDVYLKRTMRELSVYKPSGFKSIYFRGIVYKFIIKRVLGLDVMYYEVNKNPRIGIDKAFLEKHNIRAYSPDLRIEDMILKVVEKSKSNYKEFNNLIIDGGYSPDILVVDSVKKIFKKIFELPVEFAFKKHPNQEKTMNQSKLSYYELFKNCEELPTYIPVELFCNNIKKNVISIFSASLVTAAQLGHLKAISLLELVEWNNESYKKEFKGHLTKESKNNVLFPKSFEELKEILLS